MIKKQQHTISKIINRISFYLLLVAVFFISFELNAQMFDADEQEQTEAVVQEPKQVYQPPKRVANKPSNRAWNNQAANQNNKEQSVSVREVKEVKTADPEDKIYMYYRDFKINKGFTRNISCSVRFYIYSTVKEKITSISYRLKWENMETVLNFDNVNPNTPTYYDYALLGKGCYEMDKVPNIIVNRCRIKGRSQQYCSSIIQWAK